MNLKDNALTRRDFALLAPVVGCALHLIEIGSRGMDSISAAVGFTVFFGPLAIPLLAAVFYHRWSVFAVLAGFGFWVLFLAAAIVVRFVMPEEVPSIPRLLVPFGLWGWLSIVEGVRYLKHRQRAGGVA